MKSVSSQTTPRLSIILSVMVIGSIWGLLEMALGGFLHTIHFVQTGAVMGGLAISLMALFLSITRKPLLIPALGVIAASFKPFSALIFGQPVLSPYVINPATAIIVEAMAFATVAFIFNRAIEKHILARAGGGFLAGALGIVFYAAIASAFGMGKWPMLDMAAKLHTIVNTATPVALAGAVTMVTGSFIGKLSLRALSDFSKLYPPLYYAASMVLVISCWAIPPFFHLKG